MNYSPLLLSWLTTPIPKLGERSWRPNKLSFAALHCLFSPFLNDPPAGGFCTQQGDVRVRALGDCCAGNGCGENSQVHGWLWIPCKSLIVGLWFPNFIGFQVCLYIYIYIYNIYIYVYIYICMYLNNAHTVCMGQCWGFAIAFPLLIICNSFISTGVTGGGFWQPRLAGPSPHNNSLTDWDFHPS